MKWRLPIRKRWLFVAAAFVPLIVVIWLSDKVGIEGMRTVYSVQCVNGTWDGGRCSGSFAAGDRYRFRSSALRQEVIYWTAGSTAPSKKYSSCVVLDRANWKCKPEPGQERGVILEMENGRPVVPADAPQTAIRAVRKYEWFLLQSGFVVFREANFQIFR